MSEKVFSLEILTPKRTVFSGEVTSLVAPGTLGYLGILAHHAPLVTTLVPGKVTYRDSSGGETLLHLEIGGLLEVSHNHVTLLVDAIA